MVRINSPFSYILNLAKISKKTTLIIIICSILYILFEATIPFFLRDLLNSIPSREISHTLILAIVVIILYSLTKLFWTLSDYEVAQLKIITKGFLRSNLHKKMMRLPTDYFQKNLPGAILTKATADVEIVGEISPLFPALLSAIVEIVIVCFVLFKLNTILALITVATFPIYSICEKKYKPLLEKSAEKEREASDPITETIRETIAGIFTLKLFRPYKFFEDLFNNKVSRWSKISKDRARFFYVYYGSTTYIESILPFVVLGIGSILAVKKLIDFPTVVAFFAFVNRAYVPVWNINFLLTTIPGSYPSVRRICEILEHPEETKTKGLNFPPIIKIECKDLVFSFNNNTVLKKINLKIPGRQWTALVGATGCGKTTLCLLLAGLYKPTGGAIFLSNEPYLNYDTEQMRNNIIYIANKDFIFNTTILDNLCLGHYYNVEALNQISKICCIDEFTNDLYVNALNLSDGQKQRIALARALLHKPSFLILDEAMAAIDSKIEDQIINNIKREYSTLTILIVSHRLSTIYGADSIVVMKDGEIVGVGKHDFLFKECEEYKILFNKQFITT